MSALHLCLVQFADDRKDAEQADEQQHQESGQGMQLYRETAGRLGVHLHDSGQWEPTVPVYHLVVGRRVKPLGDLINRDLLEYVSQSDAVGEKNPYRAGVL